MTRTKFLAVVSTATALIAGTALADLPHTVTGDTPNDAQPYFNQYASTENGGKGLPCPHTLTPNSNADQMAAKAKLLDQKADAVDETADRADKFAKGSEAFANWASSLARTFAHPYVVAAAKAAKLGGSTGKDFAKGQAKEMRQVAKQLREWAKEARQQAELWGTIAEDCRDRTYVNKQNKKN